MDILEQAVRLKEGIDTLTLKELNVFVGRHIASMTEEYKIKDAVRKVAKDEFEKVHGRSAVSWVDYAKDFSDELSASFTLESLSADRIANL